MPLARGEFDGGYSVRSTRSTIGSIGGLASSESIDTIRPTSETSSTIHNTASTNESTSSLAEELHIALTEEVDRPQLSITSLESTDISHSASPSHHNSNHHHHHHHHHHDSQSRLIRHKSPSLVGPGYIPLSLAMSHSLNFEDRDGSHSSTEHDYDTIHHSEANNQSNEYDEFDDLVTTSSLSSYAGSARSNEDESFSPAGYISDRLTAVLNPQLLDRVVVVQAQVSGTINAKSLEISDLMEMAEKRLEELKITFAEGSKLLKRLPRI